MKAQSMKFYVDGTAALASDEAWAFRPSARFVKFPAHASKTAPDASLRDRLQDLSASVSHALRFALDTSEMYCSLKFEDVRGCAYGLFSARSLALLAAVGALVSVVSIAIGA